MQSVRLGTLFSDVKNINVGVPLASFLGPLLFLGSINKLPKVSEVLSSVLFADDTILFASGADYNYLSIMFNVELAKVSLWTTANASSMNVVTTFSMLFSNRPLGEFDDLLLMGGVCVQFEQSGQFLGKVIDNQLNLKNIYILNLCNKI